MYMVRDIYSSKRYNYVKAYFLFLYIFLFHKCFNCYFHEIHIQMVSYSPKMLLIISL